MNTLTTAAEIVNSNIEKLVDTAGQLDKQIKADTAVLDVYKSQIRPLGGGKYLGKEYQAQVISQTQTWVDSEEFVKCFENGLITREQFISAIKVSNEFAKKLLSAEKFNSISVSALGTSQVKFSKL